MDIAHKRTSRKLRLKPAVPVRPATVSQITCTQLFGIDPRRYLDLLPQLGVRVIRIGKLRIVSVNDLEAALHAMASTSSEGGPAAPVNEVGDDEPTDVDDVLRILGRRRTG